MFGPSAAYRSPALSGGGMPGSRLPGTVAALLAGAADAPTCWAGTGGGAAVPDLVHAARATRPIMAAVTRPATIRYRREAGGISSPAPSS
jgi:hypothetical protein